MRNPALQRLNAKAVEADRDAQVWLEEIRSAYLTAGQLDAEHSTWNDAKRAAAMLAWAEDNKAGTLALHDDAVRRLCALRLLIRAARSGAYELRCEADNGVTMRRRLPDPSLLGDTEVAS
ncbi:MAG: hypothetical protein AAGF73_09015 [Actinomycetota bacterium]